MNQLPDSKEFSGKLLAQALTSLTTPYKILLLKSIINHLNSGSSSILRLDDLLAGMVEALWVPVGEFKLSTGRFDKIGETISGVAKALGDHRVSFESAKETILSSLGKPSKILRYPVPTFLRPWLPEEFYRSGDLRLSKLPALQKGLDLPFRYGNGAITLSDAFISYLQANQAIVEGWLDHEFIKYLQSRNPSIPGIPSKIRTSTRNALTTQRKWWNDVLARLDVSCLYTGQALTSLDFSLDHFIPWSYVVHDRIWNLAPVTPSTNSAKGHRIPPSTYIKPLAELQYKAIQAAKFDGLFEELKWEYLDDLGVDPVAIGREDFVASMSEHLEPIHAMAARRFPAWQI